MKGRLKTWCLSFQTTFLIIFVDGFHATGLLVIRGWGTRYTIRRA
ncbi:hypothetical protein NEIMUCOT_05745 [Neisseria mucosa ATCC 25996]|uniref:Uncharacterized protein n=1 Tax=Neisseria mucosa (strain ATCC 25996 / DSM 4631 / NCTC 10774 / M26) TaxID=546266 RepID=D2ZYN1_NEIM2|nr:hypothetical protein NEIMUCOT_05745 [Neisseria mucosa ATCC 25996]